MNKSAAGFTAIVILAGIAPTPASAQPDGTTPALLAGTGSAGFSGDGGPASAAALNKPTAAAVAADGTVFVADMVNRRVRAVGPDGTIRTVAGNGGSNAPPAPLPAGTPGTGIPLGSPNTIALDAGGTLYIADSTASRVYALATDGTITVRADPEVLGGPINTINALAVSGDGTLHLADRENNRIVEIPPGDGGRPVSTPIALPISLTADTAGDVWVAGASSVLSRLRDGRAATIVSPADDNWTADDSRPDSAPFNATAVSAGQDGVYIVDNLRRLVRRLGTDGTVTTVAGLPADPFGTRDPVSLAAAMAPAGPLHLVDTVGNRVFTTPVAPRGGTGNGGTPAPIWPWVAGGAVLAVLLAALFHGLRRRPRNARPIGNEEN